MNKTKLIPKLRFPEFIEEWEQYSINELFEIKNGLNKGKEFFGHGIPILNYMDVNQNIFNDENTIQGLVDVDNKEISRYDVKFNDLFFTRTSETSEEIGLTSVYLGNSIKCVFSGFILRARPIIDNLNSLFFVYHLRTDKNRNNIIKYSSITTRALISGSNLYKMKINIPNFKEQSKIASFLSAVDKKIMLLKQKLEQMKLFKKFLMQQIFSQKLRFDGFNKEWETYKLKELCHVIKGEQLNKENMIDNGKYYVLNGGINPSGFVNKWNTIENTISISEGGNSCGFINFNTEKFWSGGHCYTLNSLIEDLVSYYLYSYLKSNQSKIMRLRVGTGLPNIQKGDIENYNISVPEKKEQEKIADFLLNIDSKIDLIQVQLNQMEEFKKGLLQQMFV